MDMISLLGLDATTACVTAFVLALGVLWMYVMFAPPSGSAREYERLEQLLSDDPAKKAALKTTPGKREAKKGKGKGRAGVEGSPKPTASLPKKKSSADPETPPPGTRDGAGEKREGVDSVKGGRGEVGGKGKGGGGGRKSPPPAAKKPEQRDELGEDEVDGGEFQLVTTTKASSKGKRNTPVVMTSSETKDTTAPGSKTVKKRKDDSVNSKTASKKSSSVVKTTAKGDIPVVSEITMTKNNYPSAAKVMEDDKVTTVKTTSSKGDAPAITKETKQAGDDSVGASEAGGKKVEPVEGEKKREEGEWHTQLSRQQLRALKQKEREKATSHQKPTSAGLEEKRQKTKKRGGVSRTPSPRESAPPPTVKREGGGEGRVGEGGGGGGKVEATATRPARRERQREPKRWNIPTDKGAPQTTFKGAGEGGVVSLPEAAPTQTAPPAEGPGGSPVAQSNISDLETAMREAACMSSTSSGDIIVMSLETTTTVTTTTNDSLVQDTEMESEPHDVVSEPNDVVFPSAMVTMDTGLEGPSEGGTEAVPVSGVESPDVDEWVVLEQPT